MKKSKQLISVIAVVLVAAVALFIFNSGSNLADFLGSKSGESMQKQYNTRSYGVTINVAPVEFKANSQTMKELKKNGLIIKSGVLTPMINQKEKQVFIKYTGNDVVDSELRTLEQKTAQL